ncbi:MAG: hypothetical protein P4L43_07480 [Syntrophobacteraceae bacterium]|nr:hypothetical protein [Syntrophobacteraceae bacterium]
MAATLSIGRKLAGSKTLPTSTIAEKDAPPATDLTYWGGGDALCKRARNLLGKLHHRRTGAWPSHGVPNHAVPSPGRSLYQNKGVDIPPEISYWIIIVIIRTAGTNLGDFLSSPAGLGLGFGKAAACMGVLFLCSLWSSGYRISPESKNKRLFPADAANASQ